MSSKRPSVTSSGNKILVLVDENSHSTSILKVESTYRFAFNLRNIARYFANQSLKTTEAEHFVRLSYVTGAVCMAYASLEAALNEFINLNALSERSPLTNSKREIIGLIIDGELTPPTSSNTLQNFNRMLRILGKSEIVEGENTYQAANLVRLLRNMLIHPQPGAVTTFSSNEKFDLSSQQPIVKSLRSHLKLDKKATFPDAILVPKTANWAVDSCEKFLSDFVNRSCVDPGFITDVERKASHKKE
jgi:hypothetical protein